LNISKAREQLGWSPKWSLDKAIDQIAIWQRAYQNNQDMSAISLSQIHSYNQS
jgi:CDP-glucose 4,6-dehydratase